MSEDSKTVTVALLCFASLLAMVLLLSKALHNRPKLNSFLSEPAMTLIVGISFSFLIYCIGSNGNEANWDDDGQRGDLATSLLEFRSDVVFMAMLPPILFNSGYQLQRELFYRHIKPIILFAVLGTTLSGFVTGFTLYGVNLLGWFGDFEPRLLELLTFGALIAATDTVSVLGVLQAKRVDPHLFSLVFGESAINDAVAIVLFRSLGEILEAGHAQTISSGLKAFVVNFSIAAIGSPVLGISFSFFMAMIFKYTDLRQNKELELSFFLLAIYIPYFLAEVAEMSGIVTIFFTGMSARRYIEPNISEETQRNANAVFKATAYLAETCIFLQLGLGVFGLSGSFNWSFVGCSFVAALFGRGVSVYPLAFLFNRSLTETEDIPMLEMDDSFSVGSESSGSAMSGSQGRRMRKRTTPFKRRDKIIPTEFMHVLWFAGLRGAVAYACATDFPDVYGHDDEITAATMFIVLVTVVLMGGGTELLLHFLQIKMNVDEKQYMKEWRTRRRLKGAFHDLEYKYVYELAVREASTIGQKTDAYQEFGAMESNKE